MALRSFAAQLYAELGLQALFASPTDVKILCLQRFVRLFAYGSSTLVLALFLLDLGHDARKVGLFMTLTLWGDVVISLALTMFADKLGRRRVIAVGSILMTMSGIVFATCSQYWILVLASIFGVISPSGNEIGPFKAIEESTLSQLVGLADRSSVIAWYTLSGAAGVALGVVTFGWVLDTLQVHHGWTPVESYRVVFWSYACLGLVKCVLSLVLSRHCEIETPKIVSETEPDERQPLLHPQPAHLTDADSTTPTGFARLKTWLPSLTSHTITLLAKLSVLFALDSLGSGIASASWLVYFFHSKFGLQEGQLGNLFFVTSILSSISSLVAASLARRIGLIKTMVFTHLPASIALGLLPIPNQKAVAMALLIVRSSITSMDSAPRQAFLAAAVLPEERTTVMGIVNVVKTLSQSMGPIIAGGFAAVNKIGIAFIIAGGLKSAYDVLMLGMFLGYRTIEEKAEDRVADGEDTVEDDTLGQNQS